MKVLKDERGRIKIELTSDDTLNLGMNIDTIDCSDYDTRLQLRALFKTATKSIGLDLDSRRLLIEAYPNIKGGGILYFTPLEASKKTDIKVHKSSASCALDFENSDALISSIEILLKGESLKNMPVSLYEIDGLFRLIINFSDEERAYISRACEFADSIYYGGSTKKYTCEYGKLLASENALYKLGEELKLNIL